MIINSTHFIICPILLLAISTTANNIFLPLGTPVTTPRNDVQVIITKHGNADLREFSVAERVDVLIAIAPPDFRESLKEEAIAAGLCK